MLWRKKKSRKENRLVALEQQCCYFKENKVLIEKVITEKYLKEMKERAMKILGQEHSWQRENKCEVLELDTYLKWSMNGQEASVAEPV